MSSEYTKTSPELTIQEEQLQFRSEKKCQKDTGNLMSFFDSGEDEISSQPNRLIWGDNLLVMQALLAKEYEGQIDLIYINPPFNTGENLQLFV